MEYRQLGGSGLYVPALCLGTATFGGTNGFEGWGHTEVEEATRMVNLCLDAGVNLFDTADVYSNGLSEEILGKAIHGLRNRLLISTKATFNLSPESRNAIGSSRFHLIQACEAIEHGSYRHLSYARFRREYPGRGDTPSLGRLGDEREGPLYRLLELLRLAFNEVAFRIGAVWMEPVRGPTGLLLLVEPGV